MLDTIINLQDIQKLLEYFPRSFINEKLEFIYPVGSKERGHHIYFTLNAKDIKKELYRKVLSSFSRAAFKTQFYGTYKDKAIHNEVLLGINKFLNTNFSKQDIELIYTNFGNGCNEKLCMEFIETDFDINFLKRVTKEYITNAIYSTERYLRN